MSSNNNPVKQPETCPGLKEFLRPTVAYVKCHVCGGEVEIWSDEEVGTCSECGAEWKRPDSNSSCLTYCEYADKCRGIIESYKK
jgi:predicted amidophosphoribosyltransferase